MPVRHSSPQERRILIGAFAILVVMVAGVGAMSSDGIGVFEIFGPRTSAIANVMTEQLAASPLSGTPTVAHAAERTPRSQVAVSAPAVAPAFVAESATSETPTSPSIDEWIADLRDDDVRENAWYAIDYLNRREVAATLGLVAALDSDDLQQRFLAAQILVTRDDPYPPRLIDVVVEALADDDIYQPNAQWSLQFLDAHPEAAHARLARALLSSDRQQRFLAAYLLARTGVAVTRAAACAILIEHLADNDTRFDAELARDALTQLSYLVLPQITQAARAPADRQSREYLERIQIDIVRRAPYARPQQAAWLGTHSPLPFKCIGGSY